MHTRRHLVYLSVFLLAACGRPPEGTLSLTGSSTVAPMASDIARAYEAEHPDLRIDVQTGGSSKGIADARRGLADIGMASRALAPDESDLDAHVVARDGLCMIVHPDNPVAELSRQQVIDIYTGKHSDWSELGQPAAPITVVSKASGRATLEVFLDFFNLEEQAIEADVIIGDNQQGILAVAGDPHAIAYVSIGAAQFERDRGTPIRLLPMDGVPPETEQVANGNYPITRSLFWVTRGPLSDEAKALIAYARSTASHEIIERHGFVPVTE